MDDAEEVQLLERDAQVQPDLRPPTKLGRLLETQQKGQPLATI